MLPTYVRDINGEPVQSFARERRVQLTYDEYPAAADQRLPRGRGPHLLPPRRASTIRAWSARSVDYVSKAGSGDRAVGGSTITQQVAKIFFTGNEYSVTRKIREAFLARRIESALSKEQILELYLNQIFLGRNAYGVQAAARAYFGKDVEQLTLAECAFLAVLPRSRRAITIRSAIRERALARRNWVLGEMARNGFITRRPARRGDRATPLATARGGGAIGQQCRRLFHGGGPPQS